LPIAVADAAELAVLPDGYWLVLDKGGLSLVDGQGRRLDRLKLRAEQLDSRAAPGGALAMVFDADAQLPVLLSVDLGQGRITASRPVPAPEFSVSSQCLYRDAQGLDHLFLVGKDGLAEQWLLSGTAPRLLRKLALPAGVEYCRVDDARHVLYLSERQFGVWAYPADGEGVPERALVAAKKPHGVLTGKLGPLAVLPDGLAVLTDGGRQMRLLRKQGDGWRAAGSRMFAKATGVVSTARGLWMRERGTWRWMPHGAARGGDGTAMPIVVARGQTDTMAQRGDAADDPAFWVAPDDARNSRVLATNKKQGLLSFDLDGRQKQFLDVGRINNVDVRQGVRLGGRTLDLAVATQRDENSLVVFEIDTRGQVRDAGHVPTDLKDIYGLCLYQPPAGGLEAFANDKHGNYVHYALAAEGNTYAATVLRRFRMGGQAEGCVADDRQGRLFVAEEDRGIWVLAADAGTGGQPRLILPVGSHLAADAEGLAIFRGPRANYLIASSQGNSSFAVLDAEPPFAYRGSFRVGINAEAGIDGVSDTDGLEAAALDLGGAYGEGMLVVQDGYKRLPDGAQNFKYLAWRDVARALGLR
jgi:3-phytase